MPYCPICEYVHKKRTVCPDCGTALIPNPDEQDSFLCDECKEHVAGDATWCGHCGTILVDSLLCFRHPENPARGKCVVCGQYTCGSCGSLHMGQFFCDFDAGAGMTAGDVDEDVVIADRKGERLRGYLSQESVPCRIFKVEEGRRAQADDDTASVKLLVPRTRKDQAEVILADRGVDLAVVRYECERCSAVSSGEASRCPNCGEE